LRLAAARVGLKERSVVPLREVVPHVAARRRDDLWRDLAGLGVEDDEALIERGFVRALHLPTAFMKRRERGFPEGERARDSSKETLPVRASRTVFACEIALHARGMVR